MTALEIKPTVKFDLSSVDPDHREWLEQQAHLFGLTINTLLRAERAGAIDLHPGFDERKDKPEDLAKSMSVTLTISDPKLRMALKRHAGREGISVEQYVAECALSLLIGAETEYRGGIDILTGQFTD